MDKDELISKEESTQPAVPVLVPDRLDDAQLLILSQSESEATPLSLHPVSVYLAGLSAGSRRTMKQSLDRIAAMVTSDQLSNAMQLNWSSLRFPHAQWIRASLAEELAPATANKCLSAMRGVLKSAWRLGLLSAEDYHRTIDIGRVPGFRLPPGRMLELGEMSAYFQCCANDRSLSAFLDAALFAAMAGGGLRRAEAMRLDFDNFNDQARHIRVIGKGNKQREVPLGEMTCAAILAWAKVRGNEPGPLFCPVLKGGKLVIRRISDQSIYERVQKRGLKSGLQRFSPHDLRRTFASTMIDAGADIVAVQRLLGHADISTTTRYDRRDERAKRKASELFYLPYVPFGRAMSSLQSTSHEDSPNESEGENNEA